MKIAGRDAMIGATNDDELDLSTTDMDVCYRAMLAASPKPTDTAEKEVGDVDDEC